jgi:hypothetical protein
MNTSSIHIAAAFLLTLITTLNAHSAQPETPPVIKDTSVISSKADLSVLEHFRTFTGQRTPDALLRLFSTPGATDTVKQKPEVVLSDGLTHVELTLTISTADNAAPNFAGIEAALISVKQIQAGVWQLDLLPEAGSWKSAVVIQQGTGSRTVPLTVAPPLSGDLSMKVFAAYLKDSQADEQQRVDLNGDGKLDYQDDYVLAVNVLVARDASPHDLATRNKRARELTPVRPKP